MPNNGDRRLIHCSKCQAKNADERRFCGECGAPLAVICGACAFENASAVKFCGGCGASLAPAPKEPEPTSSDIAGHIIQAPSGERRQVTIFFADLSGYTVLAEALDPEDLHNLVGRVFDVIDRIVREYGGTVHRHVGDEVMALFGAPVAHGDDPLRAVRTAFDTHAAMAELGAAEKRDLAVHIGIASGEVVVAGQGTDTGAGESNPDAAPEYAVTGVAANLASRLNDMAGAGETIISDAVYRDVDSLVDAESLGEVAVKGLDEAVLAWRMTAFLADGERRARSRFVGREVELSMLNSVVASVAGTGAGRAILVRGEAGIGKTRLLEEMEGLAKTKGFACHKSIVLNFGVGSGQEPIRVLVRGLLGVPSGAGEGEHRAAAERALRSGLIEAEQREFLNDLLVLEQPDELKGVYDAMENATRNQGKQTLVAGMVKRMSASQKLLISIEDVQWANPLTLAHLAHITMAVSDCAVVLVMSSRIEGDPLDQAWRGSTGGAALMTVDLGPLRNDEALQLATRFLDATGDFARNCIARAEGSPLFLEQLLRNAEGLSGGEVPGSIQSLVLARVDRLNDADKQALYAGSTIGQRFDLDLLRYLIDDPDYACTVLIENNLVRPFGGGYLFAHAMVQEGVYASLLKARRRELHLRVAGWYSNSDPGLYAEHLERAEDAGAAAAYLAAAEAEAVKYHYESALAFAERGLGLATGRGAEEYALACLQGRLFGDMGLAAKSITAYRHALSLASGDLDRCPALIGLAAGMRVTDEYDDALQALDQSEAIAAGAGLTSELARIHHLRGNIYFPIGNIDGCLQEHEKALAFAQDAGSPEGEANALSGLGDAYYLRGRMKTSLDHFQRCMDICRANGLSRIEIGNSYMVAWTRLYQNQVSEALAEALAAAEAAERVGYRRAENVARLTAGRIYYECGDLAASRSHLEKGLVLVEEMGANRFKAFHMIYLARILHAEDGTQTEAREMAGEALQISRDTGITFLGPWALSTLALVSDDPGDRQSALDEGEAIINDGCVGHNYFAFYRDAVEAALAEGDWDAADAYVASLERYNAPEPLPWCDFFMQRGAALAAHGRGQRDTELRRELSRLRDAANQMGIMRSVPSLDAALAELTG
jgi:class 3 adenylate cyclase/tetratricopeptide (TPR) repeat protein